MSYSGPITIASGVTYQLDSYGNGAAYTLIHKVRLGAPETYESVFFQGDDAATLRAELDAIERNFPNDSQDMVLSRLADPYSELFEKED